jgi:hypothetical protein
VAILCIINLVLLVLILGFQVKIMLWQSGITASLKKLENEVNQEKVQRAELGDNLLKKIDELTPAKEAAAAVPPATLAGNTTVYAKPNAKSKVAGKLKKGQTVTVSEKQGEWRKISWDGKSGWVKAAQIK